MVSWGLEWLKLGSSWNASQPFPNWGCTKVFPHLASIVSTSLRYRWSLVSTAAPFSGNDRLRWFNCSGGGEVVMISSFLCSLELFSHRQPATKIAHWDSL